MGQDPPDNKEKMKLRRRANAELDALLKVAQDHTFPGSTTMAAHKYNALEERRAKMKHPVPYHEVKQEPEPKRLTRSGTSQLASGIDGERRRYEEELPDLERSENRLVAERARAHRLANENQKFGYERPKSRFHNPFAKKVVPAPPPAVDFRGNPVPSRFKGGPARTPHAKKSL
mmetsp:Transcript_1094/g.2007  ORF Transcript_1094/g.2007 Transcript_1094/m.2007 type:complete len:174 (+) Transcript_1094:3-524(+)